jgi:hypothetical protein
MDQRVAVEIAQPKPGVAREENRGERRKGGKSEKWMNRSNKDASDRKNKGFRKNKKDHRR